VADDTLKDLDLPAEEKRKFCVNWKNFISPRLIIFRWDLTLMILSFNFVILHSQKMPVRTTQSSSRPFLNRFPLLKYAYKILQKGSVDNMHCLTSLLSINIKTPMLRECLSKTTEKLFWIWRKEKPKNVFSNLAYIARKRENRAEFERWAFGGYRCHIQ
jgi:hypothetical protein